jgi:hypothetical protein
MGELQEQIGTQLLPVMTKLTAEGLKVVDWISRNTKAAEAIVGVLFGLLAVIKAVSLATQAFTAIQTILNVVMSANPVVLIVLALVALGVALVVAYRHSETFRNIVNAAFAGIAKVVSVVVDFIKDHWKAMLIILGGPIGLAVVLIASHFDKVKAVAQAVVGWIQDHWPAIKIVLVAAFTDARDRITAVIDVIKGAISTAKTVIDTAMSGVKSAVQTVVDAFQAVVDKVQAVIDKIKSIPHPNIDIPFVGRFAGGAGGATGSPFTHDPTPRSITINVPGGFIGSEDQLARVLQPMLDAALRRRGVKAA